MAIQYFDVRSLVQNNLPMPELCRQSGTYLLILLAHGSRRITVGKLGTFDMNPGYYLYVGSAFGPGGIKARVGRHLKQGKANRWHIDYLRACSEVSQLMLDCSEIRLEDKWVERLSADERFVTPFTGFGASDSQRASHLFYCRKKPQRLQLLSTLEKAGAPSMSRI